MEDFFDDSPVALVCLNARGDITRMNSVARQWLGYGESNVVGKHICGLHADEKQVIDMMTRLGHHTKLDQFELSLRAKDNTLRSFLVSSTPFIKDGIFIHHRLALMDITAHKKDDQDRSRLAAIVESSDDAIIGKTLDGNILSWNKGAEKLYGYRADEVLGKSIRILVPEDRKNEVAGMLLRITRGETLENHETIQLHKDGQRLDVALTVSPIKDAGGTIIGASSIARDVSRRKLQEEMRVREAARQSQLRLSAVEESSTDPIIGINMTGSISRWNSAAEKLYGYRFEEVTGQPLSMLAPEQSDSVKEILDNLNHGTRVEKLHTIHKGKNGRDIYVLVNLSPVKNAFGGGGRLGNNPRCHREEESRRFTTAHGRNRGSLRRCHDQRIA